jgi:hypothetical protein
MCGKPGGLLQLVWLLHFLLLLQQPVITVYWEMPQFDRDYFHQERKVP